MSGAVVLKRASTLKISTNNFEAQDICQTSNDLVLRKLSKNLTHQKTNSKR